MPRLFSALALAALLLAGCDSATDTPDAADATADTETAALAVASAVSLDAGGVLDEAASAALASVPPDASGPPPFERPGCERSRTYDEAAALWTLTVDCERRSPGGRFYAALARVATVQFAAGGETQPMPAGADALTYRLLSGAALLRTPRGTHRVTSVTSALDVTDLDRALVTVNGTYARAGADSVRVRGGERTAVHTLDMAATDLRGPRDRHAGWRDAVSGTITGTYRATVTTTRRNGTTVTHDVERTFTVTFPGGGRATIALGGERFEADLATGEIAGLDV